jgi:hypothetical protein
MDTLDQAGRFPCHRAHDEEGCLHTLSGQSVENLRRESRRWPIVEGEDNFMIAEW